MKDVEIWEDVCRQTTPGQTAREEIKNTADGGSNLRTAANKNNHLYCNQIGGNCQ